MDNMERYKLQELCVAVVDDHEVVTEGLRAFLLQSGIRCVETFTRGEDLLKWVSVSRFDIFIVDVELSDMDAEQLIDHIRECQPDARIIINTMHEEIWVVNKMTEKNVDGVIYKSVHLDQLLEAIITVHEGRQYFCPKFKKSQSEIRLKKNILSDREMEVLQLLARGNSTKEIARLLFISENTVENHRKNLFKKLQAKNVATLLISAITAGFLNPSEL